MLPGVRPSMRFASSPRASRGAGGSADGAGVGFHFGVAANVLGRAVIGAHAGDSAINSHRQGGGEVGARADHKRAAAGFFHTPFQNGQSAADGGEQGEADRKLSGEVRRAEVDEVEFKFLREVGGADSRDRFGFWRGRCCGSGRDGGDGRRGRGRRFKFYEVKQWSCFARRSVSFWLQSSEPPPRWAVGQPVHAAKWSAL